MTSDALRVLLVCEGNVCRSPWAEIVFRRLWEELPTHRPLVVSSAGTRAVRGQRAHPLLFDLVTDVRGHRDLERHRARRADRAAVTDQDLILVMEQRHRTEILDLVPAALHRVFTLVEAAQLVRDAPASPTDRSRAPHEALAIRRRPRERHREADDIADPVNGSEDDFQEMGRHAEDLLGSVVPFVAAVCGTDDDDEEDGR